MRRKLTKPQVAAMQALWNKPWRSAYPGLHMGTLNSLALKGLVVARYGLGSIAMPHTAIKWSLTDEGRSTFEALR